MVTVKEASAPLPRRYRAFRSPWSDKRGFIVVAATMALFIGGSNLPTPLFPIYEREYHLSTSALTVLFCSYVAAVVPSLLTLGRLSDRLGRRAVLISGITLTAASSATFAAARSLGWLFAGEIIYGAGAGLVNSGAAAALRELHPQGSPTGGALGVALAQSVGLTVGPLASGALASVTPWPTVSPYLLDIVLVLLDVAALAKLRETRPPRQMNQRAPVVSVPRAIRRPFAIASAGSFAGWAGTGWVMALSPSFISSVLHRSQPVISGLFAACVLAASGTTQIVMRKMPMRRLLRIASTLSVVGLGVVTVSAVPASLPLAFVGAAVLGAGFGGVNVSTTGTILSIAPPQSRGGIVSSFLVVSYLGVSLPTIAGGTLADHVGLPASAGGLTLLLALIAAGVLSGAKWLPQ